MILFNYLPDIFSAFRFLQRFVLLSKFLTFFWEEKLSAIRPSLRAEKGYTRFQRQSNVCLEL